MVVLAQCSRCPPRKSIHSYHTVVLYRCKLVVVARAEEYEDRRRELLEAVFRITAERGLDEVSIRTVAAEAGVSVAKVQYYFRTKDELLLAGFEHVMQLLETRQQRLDYSGPMRQVLRDCLLVWLPIDAERIASTRVFLAFAVRALHSPQLAEIEVKLEEEVVSSLAALIARGQELGQIRAGVDPEQQAQLLLAVLDGLTLQMLLNPEVMTVRRGTAAVDAYLDALCSS
ncbi:TetR family transcriptional regulator [Pseudonocardiaceae bacterium YIM PH 21723]|nr:TetR family transcriptional regulator [Pseudonocardiaceae bacterium YIM PH 21723]